mmetsp:Transcript_2691/g.7620  ORF Transcript_2691/g.7620 Transcript_2691/m.7620 type:complete len:286 (-) Transcript_2691:1238-2095(-)
MTSAIGKLGEVTLKQACQLVQGGIEVLLVCPGVLWEEDLLGDVGAVGWDTQVEDLCCCVVGVSQLTGVDGVNDGTGVLDGHPAPHAVAPTCPAGVHQPHIGAVGLELLCQHAGVLHGVPHKERPSKAGGKGGLGFRDAHLCPGDLCGVATHKVIHCLLCRQLAHRGEDTKGIAGEHDNVLGVGAHAGDQSVVDVLDGVGGPGVLCHTAVGEVHHVAVVVVDHILQNGAEADGIVDVRLRHGIQVDALGVASAFDVEHALVAPAVLVIANEGAALVGGQRGLAGAG